MVHIARSQISPRALRFPLSLLTSSLGRDRRGVAVVELALVLPILLGLLMGIVSFADYFLTAHMVQQAANDAARAALAGIDAGERRTIAVDTARRLLGAAGTLRPERGEIIAVEQNNILTVSIRYDAHDDPLLNLPFVPAPGRMLSARGVAMIGGL